MGGNIGTFFGHVYFQVTVAGDGFEKSILGDGSVG